MRLTLRTLLAYLDDTLTATEAREIGLKLAETPAAQELADRIRRVTRRRGLATPPVTGEGTPSDPNTVAEYLSDSLSADLLAEYEKTCLESDVHLAEVAACHQILTLVLSEQLRVPPTARRRMYELVKGRESIPNRRPGGSIPVGGIVDEKPNPAADDAEAGLLLGLPAYSSEEPSSRRALRYGAVAVLLVAFAFALWMALPAPEKVPSERPAVAAALPRPEAGAARQQPTPPPAPAPETIAVGPRPVGEPKLPSPVLPVEEPKTQVEPPRKELVDGLPVPKQDRAAVGKLERSSGVTPILLRRPPQDDVGWTRVTVDEPTLASTDRLMALPGYRAALRLDSGATLDLWGNLPDLVPAPVLGSAVTLWVPGTGFDADVTVHGGRIYFGATKPTGAVIHLRFLNEVWDVTLADDKSEVVFELSHTLVPGALEEAARTTAGLAVVSGKAVVKFRFGQPRTLSRGDDVAWDSKGGKADVRINPQLDPAIRVARAAYLAKVPVYTDAARARPMVQALEDFSKDLSDPTKVRATFVAALQEKAPSEQSRAAERVAVFTLAALGDLPGLADALNDPNNPFLRATAAQGLPFVFAFDPSAAGRFQKVLVENSRLGEDLATAILRLIRGYSERERTRPETIDALVGGLESTSVAVRELSFMHLIGYIDVQDRTNLALLRYDAGAPDEFRGPAVAAWKKKAIELKKKLDEVPLPRPKG